MCGQSIQLSNEYFKTRIALFTQKIYTFQTENRSSMSITTMDAERKNKFADPEHKYPYSGKELSIGSWQHFF